jgi:hypothetical protein
MVDGKKFVANNPANVYLTDCPQLTSAQDACNKTYQRLATANRETTINKNAITKRQNGICKSACPTDCQFC